MKNYFLFTILFMTGAAITAQNTNLDYRFGIKVYNLSTLDQHEKIISDPITIQSYTVENREIYNFLHPTFALQWMTPKKHSHEIELTELMLNKVSSSTRYRNDSTGASFLMGGDERKSTAISLRYEFILNFMRNKETRFVPSVGFAGNPFYEQHSYQPMISGQFPSKETRAGIRGFVVPRIAYYTKKKLYFDLNLPLCLLEGYYQNESTKDPLVPVEERSVSNINFSMFPKYYSLRVGVGIRL
jgi:hypothetical protein